MKKLLIITVCLLLALTICLATVACGEIKTQTPNQTENNTNDGTADKTQNNTSPSTQAIPTGLAGAVKNVSVDTANRRLLATVAADMESLALSQLQFSSPDVSYTVYTDITLTQTASDVIPLVEGANVFYLQIDNDGENILYTAIITREAAPAHVHVYGEWTTTEPATCQKTGTREKRCECGDTITETIEKLPHTEALDAAVSATCTETGLTEGKHCSVCGEVLVARPRP